MTLRLPQLLALTAALGGALAAAPANAQSIDLRTGRYEPRSVAYACDCPTDYRALERREYRSETWSASPAPYPYPAQPYGQAYGPSYSQGWVQTTPPPPPPPPGASSNWAYYQPGVSQWRPGVILAPDFRGYRYDGWTRKHLGNPGYGRAWYKIGNEYILADTGTGEVRLIVTYP